MSVNVLGPFLTGLSVFLLRFKNSLYILDNDPLSDKSFANIFYGVFFKVLLLWACDIKIVKKWLFFIT